MKENNKLNATLRIERVKKSGKVYNNYIVRLYDGTEFKVSVLPFYPKKFYTRIRCVVEKSIREEQDNVDK